MMVMVMMMVMTVVMGMMVVMVVGMMLMVVWMGMMVIIVIAMVGDGDDVMVIAMMTRCLHRWCAFPLGVNHPWLIWMDGSL